MANYESNKDAVLKAINDAKQRALESIGLYVEGQAKALCPVDDGNLRGSITHETKSDRVVVGTNVEYAIWVEKGTGKHQVDGQGRKTPWSYKNKKGEFVTTQGQKPQPFLTPAAENNVGSIEELVRREMSKL